MVVGVYIRSIQGTSRAFQENQFISKLVTRVFKGKTNTKLKANPRNEMSERATEEDKRDSSKREKPLHARSLL